MILNLTERELHVIISALIYEKADRREELDAWKPDMTKEPIELLEERMRMIERYNEIDDLKKKLQELEGRA